MGTGRGRGRGIRATGGQEGYFGQGLRQKRCPWAGDIFELRPNDEEEPAVQRGRAVQAGGQQVQRPLGGNEMGTFED